jgi:hypothetical protein
MLGIKLNAPFFIFFLPSSDDVCCDLKTLDKDVLRSKTTFNSMSNFNIEIGRSFQNMKDNSHFYCLGFN